MGLLLAAPLGLGQGVLRRQRARGKTHHAALRALGNRWLEILWHCLIRGQRYDEATHTANRNRTLGKAA
jgi:hypothetical protein